MKTKFLIPLLLLAILIFPQYAFLDSFADNSNSTSSNTNGVNTVTSTTTPPSTSTAQSNSTSTLSSSVSPNQSPSSQNVTSQTTSGSIPTVTNSPITTPSSNSTSTLTTPLSNSTSLNTSSSVTPSNSTSTTSPTTNTALTSTTISNTQTISTSTNTLSPTSENAMQKLSGTTAIDTKSADSSTPTSTTKPTTVPIILNQPVSLTYKMDDSDGIPRVLVGKEIISYNGAVQYSGNYTTDATELFHTGTVFSQPGSWTIDFTIDTVNGKAVNLPPMHYDFVVSSSSIPQVTTLKGAIGDCIGTLEFTQNAVSSQVVTTPVSSWSDTNIAATTVTTSNGYTVTQRSQNGNYVATMSVLILDPKLILVHYHLTALHTYYVFHWGGLLTTEWNKQVLGVETIGLYGSDNNWVFGPTGVGEGSLTITITDINRVNIKPDSVSWEIYLPSSTQTVATGFKIITASAVNTQTTPVSLSSNSNEALNSTPSSKQSSSETSTTSSKITFVSATLPAATPSNPGPAIQLETQSVVIPSWIKTTANWWSQGQIKDVAFVNGMQYLIQNGIMKIPQDSQSVSGSSQQIPTWIKNNASWWANGQISDNDFVNGMQYMISNGIIQLNA